MDGNKKVIAVVVTYNRKELLKECINALLVQDYDNCDILIVDNASTDGTKEFIKDELQNEKIHYVNTGSNLGGAGGFNYGMKEAYKIGCDFMWLMDDDCIVHKDSLMELMNADSELEGNYGFLSSKVLWKDNSICKMNVQKKEFSKWLKDFETNKQTIAMASFVSLFVKTSIVEEMGLPIKEFFIWTDDWEYTRRISRKYKCYYISKSVVTHKSKQNEGASIATVDDRLERFNYLYRNDVVLYRREGMKGWILLYIRLALHKLRIIKSNKKDKINRIKIIDEAIKEGKNFFPDIEYLEEKKVKDLISVIIPAYNAEKYIKKSIDSVLNQSYSNVEVIVVDDGSTDNTIKVVKNIKDKRLFLIEKNNEGPSKARNIAIDKSNGKYIMFLDADDYLEKDIIKKISELFQKDYEIILFKTDIVLNNTKIDNCNFYSFDFNENERTKLIESIYNKFEKYNSLIGFDGVEGKVIKKKYIVKNNIKFPEDTFRYEDAIFCLNLYKKASRIYFMSEVGTYYVQNENSICHKFNPDIIETVYIALQHLYKLTDNKQLFYIKCITSLSDCERLYYLNKKNKKNKKEILEEYSKMLEKDLYEETLNNINLKGVPLSYAIEIFLLKNKKIKIYLFLKKLYFMKKYGRK